jgi:citrate synthase
MCSERTLANYYSAVEAAARLQVSRQTLYAYVSRGLLRAHPGESHRERRYLIAEVNQLAARRSRSRSPVRAVRGALDWGMPVVESSICTIDAGRLYYRGRNVLSLIDTYGAEDVAALLWQCPKQEAFASLPPLAAKVPIRRSDPNTPKFLVCSFAMAGRELPVDSWQAATGRSVRPFGDLVRMLAGCVLRARADTESLRQQCAAAWSLAPKNARLVEAALILCADHELNASSFTVRCIASTAASLHACLLGGLAALSGPRHGGITTRVETLWAEVGKATNLDAALRARLERGDDLPGFGHPLYPDGDIRASAILESLHGRRQRWRPIAQAVEQLTGQRPSLDFALVALRRHLQLPVGAAFGIFALGRSIGWIAHALEQRSQGTLIRPRAAYVGLPPEHLD